MDMEFFLGPVNFCLRLLAFYLVCVCRVLKTTLQSKELAGNIKKLVDDSV